MNFSFRLLTLIGSLFQNYFAPCILFDSSTMTNHPHEGVKMIIIHVCDQYSGFWWFVCCCWTWIEQDCYRFWRSPTWIASFLILKKKEGGGEGYLLATALNTIKILYLAAVEKGEGGLLLLNAPKLTDKKRAKCFKSMNKVSLKKKDRMQ